jgi:hypothetical protein
MAQREKYRTQEEFIISAALVAFQVAVVIQLSGASAVEGFKKGAVVAAAVGIPSLSFYMLTLHAEEVWHAEQRLWLQWPLYFVGLFASGMSILLVFASFGQLCAWLFGGIAFGGMCFWQGYQELSSRDYWKRKKQSPIQAPQSATTDVTPLGGQETRKP